MSSDPTSARHLAGAAALAGLIPIMFLDGVIASGLTFALCCLAVSLVAVLMHAFGPAPSQTRGRRGKSKPARAMADNAVPPLKAVQAAYGEPPVAAAGGIAPQPAIFKSMRARRFGS